MPSWRRQSSGQVRKGPSSSPQITIVQADAFQALAKAPAAPQLEVLYQQCVPKAWVTFTVSGGACTVAESFNVRSVTYNGAGDYTLNFATPLNSTNYCAISGGRVPIGANNEVNFSENPAITRTASALRMINYNFVGAPEDLNIGCVVIFGN